MLIQVDRYKHFEQSKAFQFLEYTLFSDDFRLANIS